MVLEDEAGQALITDDSPPMTPVRRRSKAVTFTALRKELISLKRQLQFQEERVDLVEQVADRVEEESKAVQRDIAEYKSKVTTMETHKSYMIKKQQLVDAQKVEAALTVKLDELTSAYHSGLASLHKQMKEQKHLVTLRRRQLASMGVQRLEDPSSGPEFLQFLRSDWWQMLSAVVIMLNVLCMFVKWTHPELNFSSADGLFLLFYNVEITLKIWYFQMHFFSGPGNVVGWNWLDLVLVIFGDLELLLSFFTGKGGSSFGCLRLLRLSRIARLFKAAKLWLTTDLSWTQSPRFESLMMMSICTNCIIMGAECEFPDWGIWIFMENLLLLLYVFELSARIKIDGWRFFCNDELREMFWNWFDLTVVSGGVLDTWVVPVLVKFEPATFEGSTAGGKLNEVVSIARMLRLLRVLRLVEVIKNFAPLYALVVGIAQAMQGMGWVLLLTGTLLYTSALVAVRTSSGLSGFLSDEGSVILRSTFPDMPEAVFTLFGVMNTDLSGVTPMMEAIPATRYVIMAFMIITNWTVFSILTAVVSDKMANVTDQHEEMLRTAREKEMSEEREASVEALFRRLDSNQDGKLSFDEFRVLLTDSMLSEELMAYTGFQIQSTEDMFDLLSTKGTHASEETISHDQFLRLVVMEKMPITARPMLKLNKRLMRLAAWLDQNQDKFKGLERKTSISSEGDEVAKRESSSSSSSSN